MDLTVYDNKSYFESVVIYIAFTENSLTDYMMNKKPDGLQS